MRMYSISSGNDSFKMPAHERLDINTANPVIKQLATLDESDAHALDIAKHIYLSALLLSRTLTAEEAKEFIRLNNALVK